MGIESKKGLGTTVTVSGLGFARNEQGIELMYYSGDSSETIERNIEANAQGSWETSFQIPSSSRGEHKISAQGAETNLYKVEETMFRVTAEISLDKSSGSVGDTITMTGSRFGANEKDIKILFEGEAVVTGIKASAKGEWQAREVGTIGDEIHRHRRRTGDQDRRYCRNQLRDRVRYRIVPYRRARGHGRDGHGKWICRQHRCGYHV